MAIEVHAIKTIGKKMPPGGTKLNIRLGSLPGTISLSLTLPGQGTATQYPDLPIVDGVVTIPVPMVFLSHAKEDVDVVQALADRLLQDGVITWFDEYELLPGDDWKAKIAEAIDKTDFVLVFLSSRSIDKTGYFQKEIRMALEQRELRPEGVRYIIPILLDDCQPPRTFSDINWLRTTSDGWYEKLKRALRF